MDKHLQSTDVALGAIRDKYIRGLQSHALVQLLTNGLPQRALALLGSIPAFLNRHLTDKFAAAEMDRHGGTMPKQACGDLVTYKIACQRAGANDTVYRLLGACASTHERCGTAQTRQSRP